MTDREHKTQDAREGELFRLLVENVKDYAIFVIDPEGRVESWNPGAERLLGFREEEMIGQSIAVFFTPEDIEKGFPQREMQQALKEGRGNDDRWHVRKDGSRFWCGGTMTPLWDEGHKLRGFAKIMRDRTEWKLAEQARQGSEARQAAILETALDAIITIDHEGRVVEFNPAAEKLFGYAGADVRGRDIGQLIVPPRLRQAHQLGMARYLSTGEGPVLGKRIEMPALRADGTEVAVELAITRIPTDGPPLFTAFLRDISEPKRVEEALRRSEEHLRAVVETTPACIKVVAPDGTLLDMNSAGLAMVDADRPENVNGKCVYNLVCDEYRDAFREFNEQVCRGEKGSLEFETVGLRGTRRHMETCAVPLRWPGGGFVQLAVTHDITDRKRAEVALRESEGKLRLLADTIPQLAWMARPDGHIFWYNRRWYEYTGTTPDQMEGWGWQSVHAPDVLPRVLEGWKGSIASGEPFDMVFPLKGADDEFRPFLTRVNPLRDEGGRILYWFGTNTDISDINRMEEALRDADRRKDEFLATLAHELRNPLAPIRNSLQILKMPRVDAATVERSRDMMERQVHHLVRLVDDLLDVSRVMRGKIELRRERVELATVVARAVETVQPLVDAQGHELSVGLPNESLPLDADPVRLAQVVGNLLTNAAKYTEANGRIWLTAERMGGQAVMKVRDNGIGIAPDMLPHVFDLFVQADHASTKAQGGLGIGLTLVKNLVALHGGTVEANSNGLGKGCEFVVRLPLMVQGSSTEQSIGDTVTQAQQPPLLSGYRLLVVDDNMDAANSLAMLLGLQGHEVRVAHDGPSALAVAASFRPDLIFLDIGMPGMDGFEVARRVRRMPGLERTVLAALTGWGQQEDRRRTAEAGFDHHLVKPPEPQSLDKVLAALKTRSST